MDTKQIIEKIVALDEKIASLQESFDEQSEDERLEVLTGLYRQELAKIGEDDQVPFVLARYSGLLTGITSSQVSVVVATGLGHENPDVRLLAGETLLLLAEEGLEQIMPAVKNALASTGLGAEEIPFILTEIDDPEARSVIELFLRHRDAEVIAAAIEALADLEDPLALDALAELADDERKVKVDEAIAADEEWTIGQLARDAIEMLTGEEEEEEE